MPAFYADRAVQEILVLRQAQDEDFIDVPFALILSLSKDEGARTRKP
jgi:hypothetical protein